jgi:glutamine synthetase
MVTRLTLFRTGGFVAGTADSSLRFRYIGAYEVEREAANINPYIALATAIGSGLFGIDNKIEPNPAGQGQCLRPEIREEAGLAAHRRRSRRGHAR